jgi:D-alanine transaminase
MASQLPSMTPAQRTQGLAAITIEDQRWARCDIKATALLPNVLAKQQAAEAGAQEAILIRNDEVMEGSSTSIFVVRNAIAATPPNSSRILPGTTRDVVIELSRAFMPVEIRRIGVEELRSADEVWLAAATRDVLPVTSIDAKPIGTGRPGPLWERMSAAFIALRATLADTPAL